MSESEDRILKRYSVLNNLEIFIQESVYYRTYTEDINIKARRVLYNYNDTSGSLTIK